MTESELIDELLNHMAGGGFIVVTKSTSRDEIKAIDKAVAYGLIVPDGRSSYDLTEKGHSVIEASGFDKWKRQREQRVK